MVNISKRRWVIFILFAFVGFLIDWYTKYLVVSNMKIGEAIPVMGSTLQWFFVYNKGALFGLNPKDLFPSFPTNLFFYIFSSVATILIVLYYKSLEDDKRLSLIGIALIMPGALGNLFDRVIRPADGVVDFIKVNLGFPPFNPWPIFNVADIYVSVGIALILIETLFFDKKESEDKKNEK